ncbi:MAG: cytochrome c [Chitinophagales bacterium]|nr:cytochrome c [Chitinophagales bacterium]
MRKLLKILGLLLLVLLILIGTGASYISFSSLPTYEKESFTFNAATPTPELIAHGAKIAAVQCNVCHLGSDGKLSGRKQTDLAKEFGEIYSRNITQDSAIGIGKWSAADIAYLLRTGCRPDGSYLPTYMPKYPNLSDYDLQAIIAYLKSDLPQVQPSKEEQPESAPSFLTKFLCRVAFKKLEYPSQPIEMPDTNNLVAYGRYLALGRYDCWTCHSQDFKTLNFTEPEKTPGFFCGGNTMFTLNGNEIYTANITQDEKTGIGTWTEEDFKNALVSSKRKDGKPVRYPMLPYAGLPDSEVKALWQYMRTIPAISNEVNRQWDKEDL